MSLLEGLTENQHAAVSHRDGPLLILAGPGSGKTRVVTRRIANLIAQGVRASHILAITFTNRAADEMKERVHQLIPESRVFISTFHRFCARLLRQYGSYVGLDTNFSILDTTDQKQQVRQVLSDLDFDTVHYAPDKILWRISKAKNECINAEMFQQHFEDGAGDHLDVVTAKAYGHYQRRLIEANAVDFDDLLLHTVELLEQHPELRSSLGERFRYVMVDEYQDTNLAQYRIALALCQRHRNLCVTGDPDQSVYGWRGANPGNIFSFQRDFGEHSIIPLEHNFRSTKSILRVADQLIAHNKKRLKKSLITDNPEGVAPSLLLFSDSQQEADGIAAHIRQLVEGDSGEENAPPIDWKDVAVFFRVNAMSRQLEQAFLRHRVPFQLLTGVAFYERAEVKDLMAYLRLVHNPLDRAAFMRIVNKPLRGLGKTSQDRLLKWADDQGISPLEACSRAREIPKLSKAAIAKFPAFAQLMDSFSLAASGSVAELLTLIINKTRMAEPWKSGDTEQDHERLANVEELVGAARMYDSHAGDEITLGGFLEQAALVNDVDNIDRTRGEVTLMTMHAAKGREFPVVFIVGLEEGLIPHERSLRDHDRTAVEEERRLLFVGMTRAERRLFLTQSRMRSMHGRTVPTIRSPFLDEFEISEQSEDEVPVAAWPTPAPAFKKPAASEQPLDFSSHATLMSKLQTGADLANGGKFGNVELPTGFAIGMQVRHPRYGLGTVINLQGMGAKRMVTVRFIQDGREQDFVSKHAPLQPVGV
ncbi:MAG: UvrD-helicase domain-containing protein [Planctomycetaceae bacterium]|nr:UvrD-helicase domain-containing protein [Planctomycetaceae bacterium]MCB9952016.1 UvrD-helicase domain-containing protein [Planctomycetaceae bacterium]